MFCKKCGKQLKDNAKFCTYCGNTVTYIKKASEEPPEPMPDDNDKKSAKKWLLPVCITIIILAIIAVVLLAVFIIKGKQSDQTQDQKTAEEVLDSNEGQPESKEESESVLETDISEEEDIKDVSSEAVTDSKEVSYPMEMDLDKRSREKLEKFVAVLGWSRALGIQDFTTANDAQFCYIFLDCSMLAEDLIKEKYTDVVKDGIYLGFPEETLKRYLMDSIGRYDSSITQNVVTDKLTDYICYKDGIVYVIFPDTGDTDTVQAKIQKIQEVAKDEIQIEGVLETNGYGFKYETNFTLAMSANKDSIWGGYTLKEVQKWKVQPFETIEDYILPEVDSRYYSKAELEQFSAEDLRLARNELYARHGYTFKDEMLKQYFAEKSWYRATVADVPESMLNNYEKANRDLILELEENLN